MTLMSDKKHRSTRTTLLHLPNEILKTIFNDPDFPTDTLFNLALLSQRLHYICLPLYFARHGMLQPSSSAELLIGDGYHSAEPLSALQMALYIHSIDHLHLTFPHPRMELYSLMKQFRRVRSLISRLSHVRHVTLVLDSKNCFCNTSGSDALLEEWTCTLGDLLNVIIEKSSTSLTVQHGNFLIQAYEFRSTRPQARCLRPLYKVRDAFERWVNASQPSTTRGAGWKFCRRRVRCQGKALTGTKDNAIIETSTGARTCSVLEHLSIHSNILLLPPCSTWTLSILRSSPITSLSFANIRLEPEVWSITLPLIGRAAPALTTLTLRNCSFIFPRAFRQFLCSLQHLTALDLDCSIDNPDRRFECVTPRIPRLKSLCAPSDWVISFLQASGHDTRIEHLTISPSPLRFSIRGRKHKCATRILIAVMDMLKGYPTPLTITVDLQITYPVLEWFHFELESSASIPPQLFYPVLNITAEIDEPLVEGEEVVTKWLGLFPSLQGLSLSGRGCEGRGGLQTESTVSHAVRGAMLDIRTFEICGQIVNVVD